jgi:hypothetical protein
MGLILTIIRLHVLENVCRSIVILNCKILLFTVKLVVSFCALFRILRLSQDFNLVSFHRDTSTMMNPKAGRLCISDPGEQGSPLDKLLSPFLKEF